MIVAEDIASLTNLGLTVRQARVYLALLKIREASTKTIADTLSVSRPNLYLILDSLQKLGLVEKVISNPIKYRPVTMSIAVQTLLRTKTDEYNKVKLTSKELLERTKKNKKQLLCPEINQNFTLLPSNEDNRQKIYQAYKRVKLNIRAIGSLEMFQNWDNTDFRILAEANRRGVKWQMLVEYKAYDEKLLAPLQKRKKVCIELGLVHKLLPVRYCTFDNRELFFGVQGCEFRGPHIWTGNKGLISLAEEYFKRTWQNSKHIEVKAGNIN